MPTLDEGILRLQQYGITDVLLPFLLIFTVVFAILQKMPIFGRDSKRFNVIVALVIGLAVVIPHTTSGYQALGFDIVDVINNALPGVSLILIAIVSLFLIIGLWGGEPTWEGKGTGVVALLALLAVLYIFARAAGWIGTLPYWLYWLDDPSTMALLVVVLVFIVIIGYITGDEKSSKKESSLSKISDEFGKLFGKGK